VVVGMLIWETVILGHVDKGVHPDFASDRRQGHGRRQVPGGHGHAEVDPPTAADNPLLRFDKRSVRRCLIVAICFGLPCFKAKGLSVSQSAEFPHAGSVA
jgi:hypothetical protein